MDIFTLPDDGPVDGITKLEQVDTPTSEVLSARLELSNRQTPINVIANNARQEDEVPRGREDWTQVIRRLQLGNAPGAITTFDEDMIQQNDAYALRDKYPSIHADDARDRIKELNLPLKIPDGEISERKLEMLIKRKQREIYLQSVIERGQGGFVEGGLGFVADLAGQVFDPINIASAFTPIGVARYTAALGSAGTRLARAGVRARFGAAEAAVGSTLVEPIVYFGAQALQDDYTLQDSVNAIFLGTIIGTGLHVGGGAVGDAIRGPLRNIPTETLVDAVQSQMGRALTGRQTDIGPLYRSEPVIDDISREISAGVGRPITATDRSLSLRPDEFEVAIDQRARTIEPKVYEKVDLLESQIGRFRTDIEKVFVSREKILRGDILPEMEARVEKLADFERRFAALTKKQRAGVKGKNLLARMEDLKADPFSVLEDAEDKLRGVLVDLDMQRRRLGVEVAKAREKAIREADAIGVKPSGVLEPSPKGVEVRDLETRTKDKLERLAEDGYKIRPDADYINKMAKQIIRNPEKVRSILRDVNENYDLRSRRENGSAMISEMQDSARIAQANEPHRLFTSDEGVKRIDEEYNKAKARIDDDSMIVEDKDIDVVKADAEALNNRVLSDEDGLKGDIINEMKDIDETVNSLEGQGEAVRSMANCFSRKGG